MKNSLFKNALALRVAGFSILLSIIFPLLPLSAHAQTEQPPSRQLVMKEKTTVGELPRLALVIGNAKYEHVTPLKNSAADAVDMAAVLRSLGFEVIEGEDQSKEQMEGKIREFGDKLRQQKGVGLFFYAGHGVQSNGKNFLIPVNADIPREDEIEYQGVDVRRITAKFDTAKNSLSIIILDACRNNPFAKDWSEFRAVNPDEGVGKIIAPQGTVVIYSTEPGKTASDGAGRNGLFTEALLENIKKPSVELGKLFKLVSKSVQEKSRQLQTPYIEGTNVNDFYFAETPSVNPVLPSPAVKSAEAEPEVVEKDATAREREAWELVANSEDAGDFRSFLTEFPNGSKAASAKIKLEQIFWNSVKATKDKLLIQAFLKEFPNGANASTARIKLRQLEARENAEPAKVETAKVETAKTEPEKTETTKTESVEPAAKAESAPTAKKEIVPKAETPKTAALTRTAKTKVKPAADSKLAAWTNSLGMEFITLPAGSFMMGSSEANINESLALGRKEYAEVERSWFEDEKPQHKVTFANGFRIGKTEVTQAQWSAIMGENPSFFKGCDDCPVERVSWEDAKLFVQKLNARNDGFEYRLPTEAEWEYAARGGKTGILNGKIDDVAWYHLNAENKTHPVGTLQPNSFGLYDMQGNVSEWCEDVYVENYGSASADGSANTVGDTDNHILRGGYFNDFSTYMRLPRRNKLTTKIRRSENGLRLVAIEKQQ